MDKKTVWKHDGFDKEKMFDFCEDYKTFLSECKTERECVSRIEQELKNVGALELSEAAEKKAVPAPGDIVYADMMGKALLIFRAGKRPVTDGVRLLGAHIDSPRLDLKQNPLYEDSSLAYLDTHYYGGIKKYQWVALPLALHGVVVKKDGSIIDVNIGEKEGDPVFCISDLLPHLGHKQMEKKASEVIEGEALNILIGSEPVSGTDDKACKTGDACITDKECKADTDCKSDTDGKADKEAVKANILNILKEKYGIEEEDFISAELEAVPAGGARDLGLDRSMILSYGQDDRVCGYTSYRALMDEKEPEYTSVCLLTDKEEIGSYGATGMQSRFFEDTVAEYMDLCGCFAPLAFRRLLKASHVLSSDVNAAFDPIYPEVFEKNNCSCMGNGPVITKFTGARGKSGSNDANAEYIAFLRRIMDEAGITYQTAELGKVDVGGGGTIAYMLANLGMNVIDFGVPILSMHAPFEAASKADIYETYRAYRAFLVG